ncbi:hypothetical protein G6F68_012404 [Rhizopus microsporus]|nr:hypothetical protein G6F68_012404 [Rhizopus microsporus]
MHGQMVWLAVPFSVIISWIYTSLEQVGESTENPFEGSATDVPIGRLSTMSTGSRAAGSDCAAPAHRACRRRAAAAKYFSSRVALLGVDPLPMTDSVLLFERHRPRLYAIAYRMLGAVAEAEDVVQEAWLRWDGTDRAAVQNAEAWLVTATTRLSIDRLRAAKAERENYVGVWLPEPMLMAAPATPEQIHEQADDVSVAFLYMLERLSPDARAAFLMREVFDADYEDIAQTLDKTQAAVRQLVRRAKQHAAISTACMRC